MQNAFPTFQTCLLSYYAILHFTVLRFRPSMCIVDRIRACAAVVRELLDDLAVDFVGKTRMFTAGRDDLPDAVQHVVV